MKFVRHSLTCQVGAYAKRFRFLQLEHEEVSERLTMLERLFKQHDCTSSEELLDTAAKAEQDLDRWFQMEGVRADIYSLLKMDSMVSLLQQTSAIALEDV